MRYDDYEGENEKKIGSNCSVRLTLEKDHEICVIISLAREFPRIFKVCKTGQPARE